ncbi:559_t:CDS:1 [Paraglomus brasilianum]|uniref:559_t:CDS:1 n=1 Tax=Paraglomus brasilianum TaxID=144538 RepID=A0A9N9BEB7_9GLOM|nr:559_t:CDS:1 [Paraglomus brasilianum]
MTQEELELEFERLVQSTVNIIRNRYKNNVKIYFGTLKGLFNEEYVKLREFLEYDQVDKTIFALWALQNPDNVKYDIVRTSGSKLVMAFYTDASAGFYFDPTQDQLEVFESNTKYPTCWSNEDEKKYTKNYSQVIIVELLIESHHPRQ